MRKETGSLVGYVLVSTDHAVFLAGELPNFWPTAGAAKLFAKKYSIAKSWKPRKVKVIIY